MCTDVEVLSQVHRVNIVTLLGSNKDDISTYLRILVLSVVTWGVVYLHSEVHVIHRDLKNAKVILDKGFRGRFGDFVVTKSLFDKNTGITVLGHIQHTFETLSEIHTMTHHQCWCLIHGELSRLSSTKWTFVIRKMSVIRAVMEEEMLPMIRGEWVARASDSWTSNAGQTYLGTTTH